MYKINGNPEQFADLEVFHKLSKQFLPYAQERLGFDKPVGINLISDPQNAKNPLAKTAHYDPNKMEVTVFVDKRHVKDILRSMSHELVHHTQNCRGEFDGGIKTGPGYAQEDEHMRDMERQAYEKGQMILRDFEDKYKKENQQMSEGKKPMTAKQKKFAALAEPKDKITYADKIAGATGATKKPKKQQAEGAKEKAVSEDQQQRKNKWKNPDGETGVVTCTPQPCTEKEAADKIRSKAKAKARPEKAPPKKDRERIRLEEEEIDEGKGKLCPKCKKLICEPHCNGGGDEGQMNEDDNPGGQGDEGPGTSTDAKEYAPGEKPPEPAKGQKDNKKEKEEKERGANTDPMNENWTRKNKDQLLFERLTKLWTK